MSKQIDERIVRMSFENEKFEKNVSKTMSTLDKLKEKLLLKKSGEGFENLQKSADKVSFEHLVESVDKLSNTVQHRTGILGGMFEELGRRIVNIFDNTFGKVRSMINQVTFEPIMTGLSEYELKINSVQVIASNTGVLMRDALEELGKSTKKTTNATEELYETAIYQNKAYNASLTETTNTMTKMFDSASVSSDDLQAAFDVMMGNYGDGFERIQLLGDRYADVQDTVNALIADTGSVSGALQALREIGYDTSGVLYSYDETGNLVSKTMDVMSDSIDGVSSSFDNMSEAAEYTMDDIDHVLDILNTYADKTIYNYAQMTDGIGKFTVQSVDLYDSLTAVMGFANLAAFTGTNNMQAMHVMQEAAKGLATGFINYQDWTSFETTGGMGSAEFQQQLIDTAEHLWNIDEAYKQTVLDLNADVKENAYKINPKTKSLGKWIKETGRFKYSLKAGWLTDQVLIQTMHKYANDWSRKEWEAAGYTEKEIADIQALGQVAFEAATKAKTFHQMWDAVTEAAQSSWTTTWEYIFGKFYDARNLWTEVSDELSDVIGGMNEARNEAFKFWANSPFGRPKFLQALANLYYLLKEFMSDLVDVWVDAFGVLNGPDMVRFSANFYNFTEALANSENVQYGLLILVKVFEIFVRLLHLAWTVITYLIAGVGDLAASFGLLVDATPLQTIYEFLDGVTGAEIALLGLAGVASAIPLAIYGAITSLDDLSKEFLGFSFIEVIKNAFTNIKEQILTFKSYIESGDLIGAIVNMFNSIKKSITDKINSVYKSVSEFISKKFSDTGNMFSNIVRIIGALIAARTLRNILKVINLGSDIAGFLTSIFQGVDDTLEEMNEAFETVKKYAKVDTVIAIALAIFSIAASLALLSLIPSDKLKEVCGVLLEITVVIVVVLKALTNAFDIIPNGAIVSAAASVALFAIGISIIVGALIALSLAMAVLDPTATAGALVYIGAIMFAVGLLVKSLDHMRFSNNILLAGVVIIALTGVITWLVVLMSVVSLIAYVNPDGLGEAFVIIVALIFFVGVLAYALAGISSITFDFRNLIAVGVAVGLVLATITVIVLNLALITALIIGANYYMEKAGITDSSENPFVVALYTMIAIISVIVIVTGLLAAIATYMTPAKIGAIVTVGVALNLVIGTILIVVLALGVLTKIIIDANNYSDQAGITDSKQNPFVVALYTTVSLLAIIAAVIVAVVFALEHFARRKTALTILASAVAINLIVMAISYLLIILTTLTASLNENQVKMIIEVLAWLGVIAAALAAVMGIFGKAGGGGNTVNKLFNFGNSGLFSIAKFVTAIALLLLTISGSILMVVYALDKLADVAEKYSKSENLSEKIANVFISVADGLAIGGKAISAAIRHDDLADALGQWLIGVLRALTDVLGALCADLVELVGIVAKAIVDAVWLILQALAGEDFDFEAFFSETDIAKSLEMMSKSPLTKIIDAIVAIIAIIIFGVGQALYEGSGPIAIAIAYLLVGVFKLIMTLVFYIFGLIASSFGDFDFSYIEGWMDDWENLWSNWWFETHGFFENTVYPGLKGFGYNIMLAGYSIVEAAVALVDLLWRPLDEMAWRLREFANDPLGMDGKTYKYERPKWIQDVFDTYNELLDKSSAYNYAAGTMGTYLADMGYNVQQPIDTATDSINAASAAIDNLNGKEADVLITMTPKLGTDTDQIGLGIFKAVEKGAEDSKQAFKDAWGIHSPAAEAKPYGESIGEGTSIGMENFFTSDKAKEIMKRAGDTVKEQFTSAFGNIDYKSMFGADQMQLDPNLQQIYNFDTAGIGNDLMNGEGDFGTLFGSMAENAGYTNDGIQDIDTNLTDSTSPFGQIMSAIGGDSDNMSAALANENAYSQEVSDALAAENGKFYDDSELIDEFEGLRSDIGALSEAMSKIKMYLDSGKLVGELVGPLDEALSQRAVRANRGN